MNTLRSNITLLRNVHSQNIYFRFVRANDNSNKRHSSTHCNSLAAQKVYNEHLLKLESRMEKSDADFHDSAFQIGKSLFTDKAVIINSSWISERNAELISYGVQTPFQGREQIVLKTFRSLAPKSMLVDKQILNAHLLAFSANLYLWATIMADDIIDGNTGTRRHKPCWHVKAGPLAVVDIIFLLSGIPVVFKNFMAQEPYYQKCLDVLNELLWITCCLEMEDYSCFDVFKKKRECLNFEFYRQLVGFKMGYGGVYYSVLLGMRMAGFDPDSVDDQLKPIISLFGFYLQSLNDYCDRYGTTTGKTLDEDIKAGKLSWLLLTAIKDSSPAQRRVLEECYGSKDEEKVNAVIELYKDLKIQEKFLEHEFETTEIIKKKLQNIENPDVREIYEFCLEKSTSWYN